ncbi:hypothetical protein BUALT_Bualt10G0013400 [Buddleja alternifolia]|uniref:Uncharacterized protein n=1 Tax=Buddleja alternifolia TaxID=168488 RepID=A0AAV6X2F4_9LAMI|nr:hypothetical protein BUALT_Bualt10G0013400 [Buddleja alternifolia]
MQNNELIFNASRDGNVYCINLDELTKQKIECLVVADEGNGTWHRRVWPANMTLLHLDLFGPLKSDPDSPKPETAISAAHKRWFACKRRPVEDLGHCLVGAPIDGAAPSARLWRMGLALIFLWLQRLRQKPPPNLDMSTSDSFTPPLTDVTPNPNLIAMESQGDALNQLLSDELEGKFALLDTSSVDDDLASLKKELFGTTKSLPCDSDCCLYVYARWTG